MASKSLNTRELQKSRYQSFMETRTNALKEKGVAAPDLAKDPKIKQVKAKIKQVNAAIARISFLEEQTKQLEEKKAQRKADAEALRAAMIAGETGKKEKKKKAEEKKDAAAGKKKQGGAKAPAKGKPQPKKKGK
ncbi:MAG: hypothetical protein V1792_02515 [Pseudomonadota bacterium]